MHADKKVMVAFTVGACLLTVDTLRNDLVMWVGVRVFGKMLGLFLFLVYRRVLCPIVRVWERESTAYSAETPLASLALLCCHFYTFIVFCIYILFVRLRVFVSITVYNS